MFISAPYLSRSDSAPVSSRTCKFFFSENPVGSTICSLALIPAYRKMAGFEDISHKRVKAKVMWKLCGVWARVHYSSPQWFQLPLDKDLQTELEYLQCKVTGRRDGIATVETIISNDKEAGRQFQYGINALAVLPARRDYRSSIQKGDNIDVLLIDVNNTNWYWVAPCAPRCNLRYYFRDMYM